LLRNFIGLDPRVLDIGEGDAPFFHQPGHPRYLRLIPDEELECLIRQSRQDWVLLKPLHDTQQAGALLDRYAPAKGIGIFRHYIPVIDSHLRYYRHDPLEYLRPLTEMDENSWMLEGCDGSTLEQLPALVRDGEGNPEYLYGVFWWVRNRLMIKQCRSRCLVLSYEQLVLSPDEMRERIEQHLGHQLRGISEAMPHRASLSKGEGRSLPGSIQEACDGVLEELKALSQGR
jgi:hypothetical protein